jgi:hypothetical protein
VFLQVGLRNRKSADNAVPAAGDRNLAAPFASTDDAMTIAVGAAMK